ncbi:MAG: hydrolase [Solirubrobacteraceae bacterium]|nr:hydrolase [Solirubrobacteraceae bacterium]
MSLLKRDRAALVVVDVQEGFRPAVERFDEVVAQTVKLVRGARELGVPVIVTEQYPKGLGATVSEVADHLPDDSDPIEKTVFSAARAEGFELAGRGQAIVVGIEAHVCVSQTAHDLMADGIDVHIVADAVSSRAPEDRDRALARLERSGATVTTTEAALFELLERAGSPEFKFIQSLVK